MKVLKIREYLKEQQLFASMSIDDVSGELNQAFVSILKTLGSGVANKSIVLNANEQGCFCVKLQVQLIPTSSIRYIAIEIRTELLEMLYEQNMSQVIVRGFIITPMIIDVYDNNKPTRGVLAFLKLIK
jgi:hypothetical protein